MSILDKPLGERLTPQDRIYLAGLKNHEGFSVLMKLFEEICNAAHAETVKVDPRAPNYKDVLAATHIEERCIQLVCNALKKNFEWNVTLGIQQMEKDQLKKEQN